MTTKCLLPSPVPRLTTKRRDPAKRHAGTVTLCLNRTPLLSRPRTRRCCTLDTFPSLSCFRGCSSHHRLPLWPDSPPPVILCPLSPSSELLQVLRHFLPSAPTLTINPVHQYSASPRAPDFFVLHHLVLSSTLHTPISTHSAFSQSCGYRSSPRACPAQERTAPDSASARQISCAALTPPSERMLHQ